MMENINHNHHNVQASSKVIQERVTFVNEKILKVVKQEFVQLVGPSFSEATDAARKAKGQFWLYQKTPEERVKLVKETFNECVVPQPKPEILEKYEKNADTSNLLRDHGNQLFQQRKYQDALHYFNMALLFGLDESLGLAYANRAAVLMELDDPAGALEDIDLALKNNYPPSQIQKLEQRKLKCLQMIEKTESEDAAIKHLIDEERAELIKVRDSFNRIEKRNPRAPAAAEFVEIKFDETYGRQLVVTRDVDAGTLLLVEEPFVCVLAGQLNWDTEHCHHCFKRMRRGIPCGKCVFAFYCGEACLKKALESTHGIECNIMPYLHLNRLLDHAYEALKLICKVGPTELYRLFTTRDPAFFNRNQAFGTAPEDRYESDSYLSVYHLQSHPDNICQKCFGNMGQFRHILRALLLTEYLQTGTEFFESTPKENLNEFKSFVAALMVHHFESRGVNPAALTEINGLEDLTLEAILRQRTHDPEKLIARFMSEEFQLKKFATGTYALCSLMNHSCDPNVTPFHSMTDGTISVIANRRLKKGEQILTSYERTFFTDEKKNRQGRLSLYSFYCECIACRNYWPTSDMIPVGVRFSCPSCSKMFSHDERDSEEFLKCELKKPSWTCGRCGTRQNFLELCKRYDINVKLKLQAFDMLLLRGDPREAVRMAIKLTDFFQYALIPPVEQTGDLQELLSFSLMFIMQLAQQQ